MFICYFQPYLLYGKKIFLSKSAIFYRLLANDMILAQYIKLHDSEFENSH